MKQRLSNAELQNIWIKWIDTFIDEYPSEARFQSKEYWRRSRYDNQYRYYGLAVKFEDWLMSYGAVVKQFKGIRRLEFITHEQATWFILKWL